MEYSIGDETKYTIKQGVGKYWTFYREGLWHWSEVNGGFPLFCVFSGQYSADDAWDFHDLEEEITKAYFWDSVFVFHSFFLGHKNKQLLQRQMESVP